MPVFMFAPSRRFQQTERESDRRFANFLATEQKKTVDHLASVQEELSKQLGELSKQFADAVNQAHVESEQLQGTLDDAIASEADKLDALQTQLRDVFTQWTDQLNKAISDFPAVIYGTLAKLQNQSAGTPIAVNADSSGSDVPKRAQNLLIAGAAGVPGSFMPSYGVPPEAGYLRCDGTIRKIADYQNLYNSGMGATFNTGLEPDGYFRLPSSADLPTLPLNAKWYVRT